MSTWRLDMCWRCGAEIPEYSNLCGRCSLRSWAAGIVANQRCYARRLGVENTLTTDQWLEKLESAQGCCFYCGRYVGIRSLYMEHQTPLKRGGPNAIDNVVPACPGCNISKRSMTAAEFAEKIAAQKPERVTPW